MAKPQYAVRAFMGDYDCDHQPLWNHSFSELETAIDAAIFTWKYFQTWRTGEGSADLAIGDPQAMGTADDFVVLIFDEINDELCLNPMFVIGRNRAAQLALDVT